MFVEMHQVGESVCSERAIVKEQRHVSLRLHASVV